MQQKHFTDEEIGIRASLTSRDRAVQRASEVLRRRLAKEWPRLSDDDITTLEWMLGELWAASPHGRWESLRFGRITSDDFYRMLSLAKRLREEHSLWLLREVETLLTRHEQ